MSPLWSQFSSLQNHEKYSSVVQNHRVYGISLQHPEQTKTPILNHLQGKGRYWLMKHSSNMTGSKEASCGEMFTFSFHLCSPHQVTSFSPTLGNLDFQSSSKFIHIWWNKPKVKRLFSLHQFQEEIAKKSSYRAHENLTKSLNQSLWIGKW